MTFALFKIVWALLRPGTLIALGLAAGVGLWSLGRRRWRKAGQALSVVIAATLVAFLLLPLGSLVTAPLERAVERARLPDDVAGIIILGGAAHAPLTERHGVASVNEAGERILSGLALARRFATARVVYSGGNAVPFAQGGRESDVARQIFSDLGFSGPRFLFEAESRNTRENAIKTKALVEPRPGEAWVLVTSAAHMPRALAVFEAVDWPILAFPVDYRTEGFADPSVDMNVVEELELFEYGVREWLGLAAYRLRGWTRSLWPGAAHAPQSSG